jgi:histidinol phosphatase-like PHP family hydrolase
MFGWTEPAASVLQRGGSLTELWRVGPWVAQMLSEWIADPPEIPEPPALRRGFLTRADVDAALAGHDDWRTEIRADLQMHTTYSDGSVPLPGMAEAAAALGYEYIGITDHSKGLPIANGMDEERLARQGEEVAALNRTLRAAGSGPRVLHSIEMNLSPEGEGDMEPEALARLDLVLGAFHSKLRLTEDQTDRYLAAVRNPTVHVLAHPRCRMFDRRAGLWADWERVFAAAADAGTAVEIDANPYRQDLDVELLTVARGAGVRISIGTDAHSVGELRYMDFGLAAAILAGIPKDRILNFQPVEDVLAWASERRRRGASS